MRLIKLQHKSHGKAQQLITAQTNLQWTEEYPVLPRYCDYTGSRKALGSLALGHETWKNLHSPKGPVVRLPGSL